MSHHIGRLVGAVFKAVFASEIKVAKRKSQKYLPSFLRIGGAQTKSWEFYQDGLEAAQAKNYHGAIRFYDTAISIQSDRASFYIDRGVAKARVGDAQGALNDYQTAKELDPVIFGNRLAHGLAGLDGET